MPGAIRLVFGPRRGGMRSLRSSPQADGIDAVRPARNGADAAEAGATGGCDWAICCSGGGIRSAAYCLGALQSLQAGGLLAKAKWTLGVSGGSYIAASRALVAHELAAAPGDSALAELEPAAYAPGTPEERNLRLDTRYIAPDGATVLVGALSLLLGVIVTFVLALAPVYALAHAWGWLLRWQGVAVPSGNHDVSAQVTAAGWWPFPAILTGATLLLFLAWWCSLHPNKAADPAGGDTPWWQFLKPDDRDSGHNRAVVVTRAAILAVGAAAAMLGLPL